MRIACWSGPRNIWTAMMRAFGSRKDCAVTDEPLYAAYLHTTGKNHPVRDAVIASQSTDPSQVTREITGLGLKEAKEFVESAPKIVKEGLSKDEANALKEKYEAVGASVTIK